MLLFLREKSQHIESEFTHSTQPSTFIIFWWLKIPFSWFVWLLMRTPAYRILSSCKKCWLQLSYKWLWFAQHYSSESVQPSYTYKIYWHLKVFCLTLGIRVTAFAFLATYLQKCFVELYDCTFCIIPCAAYNFRRDQDIDSIILLLCEQF